MRSLGIDIVYRAKLIHLVKALFGGIQILLGEDLYGAAAVRKLGGRYAKEA
jgi:hypothetical protein